MQVIEIKTRNSEMQNTEINNKYGKQSCRFLNILVSCIIILYLSLVSEYKHFLRTYCYQHQDRRCSYLLKIFVNILTTFLSGTTKTCMCLTCFGYSSILTLQLKIKLLGLHSCLILKLANIIYSLQILRHLTDCISFCIFFYEIVTFCTVFNLMQIVRDWGCLNKRFSLTLEHHASKS